MEQKKINFSHVKTILNKMVGQKLYPEIGIGGRLFAEVGLFSPEQIKHWVFRKHNGQKGPYRLICYDGDWQVNRDGQYLIDRWSDSIDQDKFWQTVRSLLGLTIQSFTVKKDLTMGLENNYQLVLPHGDYESFFSLQDRKLQQEFNVYNNLTVEVGHLTFG
jgi:hypothetical protein